MHALAYRRHLPASVSDIHVTKLNLEQGCLLAPKHRVAPPLQTRPNFSFVLTSHLHLDILTPSSFIPAWRKSRLPHRLIDDESDARPRR